ASGEYTAAYTDENHVLNPGRLYPDRLPGEHAVDIDQTLLTIGPPRRDAGPVTARDRGVPTDHQRCSALAGQADARYAFRRRDDSHRQPLHIVVGPLDPYVDQVAGAQILDAQPLAHPAPDRDAPAATTPLTGAARCCRDDGADIQ